MVNDKQNLLSSNYDSTINIYNKIIDEIESCLKTGDNCSNTFKLFLTVNCLKNIDIIVKQELSSELKEEFVNNIASNFNNQDIGFEKIKELTDYIIEQLKIQKTKINEWTKNPDNHHFDNNAYIAIRLLGNISFYTGWCMLNVKNIDIILYFKNTIEKISDLTSLSDYPDIYDFIIMIF